MAKSKLTPEVHAKIVGAIRGGSYKETAAALGGVNRSTLYRWLQIGAAQTRGIYRDFAEAVEQAAAHAEVRDVAIVSAAAKTHWQAAAWRLERKYPQKWGRRTVIQIGDESDRMTATELDLSIYSDHQLQTLKDLLKQGTKPDKEKEKAK